MGSSLISTHTHAGAAVPDNSTVIASMLTAFSATTQPFAFRLRGASDATFDQLKTYASANTTLVTTTITARKNGTDQSLTLSYGSGETGEKQDTSNSFDASDGDDIDVSIVVANDTSGSKTITLHSISMRCTTTGDTISRVGACTTGTGISFTTASVTRFFNQALVFNSAEYGVHALSTAELSNLYVSVRSNTQTTSTSFKSRINFADGNQVVTYASGETGVKEDTSNTDSLASGDDWGLAMTTGTDGTTMTIDAVSMVFASADGEYELIQGDQASWSAGTTRYNAPRSAASTTNANWSKAEVRGFAADYVNLRAEVSANASVANSTIALRVEGADSALLLTYAPGETGVKSDTDTVSVADDDRLCFRISAGGGGTVTTRWIAVTGVASATSVDLSPVGIDSTVALGTPALSLVAAPAAISSTTALGTAAIAVTITPDGIDSTVAFGTTHIDTGAPTEVDLSPVGIASTVALGTPSLSLAASPVGIASTTSLGTPGIACTLTAGGIASTASLGTPTLSATLAPSGIASTVASGTPTISIAIAIAADSVESTTTIGTPSVAPGFAPASIASTVDWGEPAIGLRIAPAGIASTVALGTPALSVIHRRIVGTVSISRGLAGSVRVSRAIESDVRISRGISGTVEV